MNDDNAAIAALVCGILSWIFCPIILAIAAIVLGSGKSSGVARAGVVLGWLNIIVSLAGMAIFLLVGGAAAVFG